MECDVEGSSVDTTGMTSGYDRAARSCIFEGSGTSDAHFGEASARLRILIVEVSDGSRQRNGEGLGARVSNW
jgi:hypothetical protein